MRCPGCGKNIDESILPPPLTYCPYCGQNLKASSTERVIEGKLFCPHCGKELPGKVSFCPYCGAELAKYITIDYDKLKEGESTERGVKPIIEPLPGQRKIRGKLYKEWVKYANLSPEVTPSTKVPRDMPVERWKKVQRFPTLYIMLGGGIIVFVVIAILLTSSC